MMSGVRHEVENMDIVKENALCIYVSREKVMIVSQSALIG